MKLEELRASVDVLEGHQADALRERYVATFVDTSSGGYRRIVQSTREYEDGFGYKGYLWEALGRWEHAAEEEIVAEMEEAAGTWFALWDLNTSTTIFVPDYWKFPKPSVLRGKAGVLVEGREFLPEDVYYVPEAFDRSLILTHEHDPTGTRRLCARALPREPARER
jgi:hypothetical protein